MRRAHFDVVHAMVVLMLVVNGVAGGPEVPPVGTNCMRDAWDKIEFRCESRQGDVKRKGKMSEPYLWLVSKFLEVWGPPCGL